QQGRNVALLLLRRATVVEAYGARFLAATDERYDGRKLFLHEPEGERRDAGAAGFLWQSQPGEAERGAHVDNLAGDFAGQRLVRILRLQDRVDVALDHLPDRFLNELLLVRELEIHAAPLPESVPWIAR